MVTVIVSAPEPRPLHLDKAELAGARNATLDVVAESLELAVGRLEAEATLDFHDDLSRARRCGADSFCWTNMRSTASLVSGKLAPGGNVSRAFR